jgi:putative glutamine amidotransferase
MKPLIGLNLDVTAGPPEKVDLQTTYYQAIFAVGGIPLLVPPMPDEDLEDVLDTLSGIVLCGGIDYSPARYGEEAGPKSQLVHPKRDDFDFRLFHRAVNRKQMPLLGICAGCQLMNVAFGGSLVQDIELDLPPSTVKHTGQAGWKVRDWHDIEFTPGSRLHNIYKINRLSVPTNHHQGIKVVGQGLKAAAHADDGQIEALEVADGKFVLSVMWHPERHFPGNEALFKEFLMHAKVAVPERR